jgi:hypothetical protein
VHSSRDEEKPDRRDYDHLEERSSDVRTALLVVALPPLPLFTFVILTRTFARANVRTKSIRRASGDVKPAAQGLSMPHSLCGMTHDMQVSPHGLACATAVPPSARVRRRQERGRDRAHAIPARRTRRRRPRCCSACVWRMARERINEAWPRSLMRSLRGTMTTRSKSALPDLEPRKVDER